MTETELKLFKALQGVFKEKMGEWQEYDRCYQNGRYGTIVYLFMDDKPSKIMVFYDLAPEPVPLEKDALRLPLPIDPRNPERGLWGMIDWKRLSNPPSPNAKYIEGHIYSGQLKIWMGLYNNIEGTTPTEALLRALAWQKGVGVDDIAKQALNMEVE